jgi:starch-binding outer membrane protein SusE/F
MMKKLLMFCAVFLMGTAIMKADFPMVGIVGGSTSVGWNAGSSLQMTTADGVTYTYSGLEITVPDVDPGVKFVQDNAWDINWGGSGFPTGTGSQNGANIPATNGTWDVTLNITTGAYSFVPSGAVFDEVTLMGGGMVVSLSTADGSNYYVSNTTLAEGTYYFTINGAGEYGGADFPAGTASAEMSITVPAGNYNISFNTDTMMYEFSFPVISLVGSVLDPDWAIDADLYSDDGIYYLGVNVVLVEGLAKFRQDHAWAINWGSADFPSGTGVQNGDNIPVPAGTYTIMFNRLTGEYWFMDAEASPVIALEGGDGVSIMFNTIDFETYTASGVALAAGDYYLTINGMGHWGGSFPTGTATENAVITVPAGTYDISVYGDTGDYNFTALAGLETLVKQVIMVQPNPANTVWNITTGGATINQVDVLDVTGKVVLSTTVNATQATVNAAGLANGVYFARITGESNGTVKLVKN